MRVFSLVALALLFAVPAVMRAEEAVKPIKALLITGGCCHDYTAQKMIIAEGISSRAQVEWTIAHQGGSATNSKIALHQQADWASGYDVIVHNECFAHIEDKAWTQRVLKPHQEGVPAVVIHCAMHCYRDKTDEWFKFLGVTSHRHGGNFAIDVSNKAVDHPIMKDFPETWKTPKGELYHIAKVWDTATPLASGYSPETQSDHVCLWTNEYNKARVFGTTLGHHNEEMKDPVFMTYLTRGLLWATNKLDDERYLQPMKEMKIVEIKEEKPEEKGPTGEPTPAKKPE